MKTGVHRPSRVRRRPSRRPPGVGLRQAAETFWRHSPTRRFLRPRWRACGDRLRRTQPSFPAGRRRHGALSMVRTALLDQRLLRVTSGQTIVGRLTHAPELDRLVADLRAKYGLTRDRMQMPQPPWQTHRPQARAVEDQRQPAHTGPPRATASPTPSETRGDAPRCADMRSLTSPLPDVLRRHSGCTFAIAPVANNDWLHGVGTVDISRPAAP